MKIDLNNVDRPGALFQMYGVMPYTGSQLLGVGGNRRPSAGEQNGQGEAAGSSAQYQIGESGLEVTTG